MIKKDIEKEKLEGRNTMKERKKEKTNDEQIAMVGKTEKKEVNLNFMRDRKLIEKCKDPEIKEERISKCKEIDRQQAKKESNINSIKKAMEAYENYEKIKIINEDILLILGDAIKVLKTLPNNIINLVSVDLPYGTTACEWDEIIPLDAMWREINRITKYDAVKIFTANQPFTWKLCNSNPSEFKYEMIWIKPNATSPYAAKYMPMKRHENILVFCKNKGTYNPQMRKGKPYKWNSKRSGGKASNIKQTKETPINNKGTRYPTSILEISQERGLHPTQKPVELFEWIIKTYSNSGEIILDFTMGSGTTGIACMRTNRKFIGVEIEKNYFDIACKRIGGIL